MDISRAFATAALLALLPGPALAFDLTGTWQGKASCKGLADGETFKRSKFEVSAGVSQSGRDVNINFAGLSFVTGASGIAVPSSKKPEKGELGFVSCGTEPEPIFGVTGRAKVATTPSKGTGTIKFTAVVAGKDIGDLGVNDAVFTCTGAMKRTATADPAIGGCF
jgi:hypothetical protein